MSALTTMKDFLTVDGELGFDIALYKRFSSIGDNCYADICGGFNEGVYQWASHNIDSVDECKNHKFTGWTIFFANGEERKVYVPNWVMEIKPSNWRHAKNLFDKYLKVAN